MCKFIIACLISLSALSFSSCTQKKVATSVVYMDFPQTIELKARVQPLDTALFRYPFRVRVQGDKAVVMDLHGTDYFCHVFHYPGFRYLASFGKRGEAPEEMLSAENVRWNGDFCGCSMLVSRKSIDMVSFHPAAHCLVKRR